MSLTLHVHQLRSPHGRLLQGLQCTIAAGQVHTLMGPSGSGKSSLLAAICGTLSSAMEWQGTVSLNGVTLDAMPTQQRHIGLLFQDALLFAHMTVRENLLFATPSADPARREAAVRQALDDVEMGAHLHADPATLSGGQRSRIALARALLAQPRALLLDEPFAQLDSALRARMRTLLFELVARRQIPALLVTHDAQDIADPAHLTVLT